MKIAFICAVFPPEPEPSGVMAQQLAARLSAGGHSVSVVVPFPNRPHGKLYPGFHRRLREVNSAPQGYRIVRCGTWLIGKRRRTLDRVLEIIVFGIAAAYALFREGRPNVMIVETWPLFAVQFAALLARWWRVPFLYYVQDVYPEAAERVGLLRDGGLAARLCRFWDSRLCRSSATVIVISNSMRELMVASRALPQSHFVVIPDWLDAAEFAVQPIDNAWRREQGIPANTFVAMFGGTLGLVSGVGILIDVALLLRDRLDVLILCVGEGVEKDRMIDRARSLELHNIRFLPFQPRERVPEVQGAANITLLTMQPGYSEASVPSKLISYMASGRAVICAAPLDATVAQIIAESNAGLVIQPGDAQALARAIRQLAEHSAETACMGHRARSYFEQHFTLDRAYEQFSKLLAVAGMSDSDEPLQNSAGERRVSPALGRKL
jgi:colanic acid biosynthesis glycosyl transferase WcaI